jgi:hypothetical protein
MTARGQARAFAGAVVALWLLFFTQALATPILLDDWFERRYWRDHDFGIGALYAHAHHNYFHYNPRLGDVLLAIIDGAPVVHLVVTPLVQVAVLPIVFAIAFGRWPRATLRDLEQLLFIQVMIWLVIPVPGILYFYRPFATNYLWTFTLTLALFVPYRLALARGAAPARPWLAPVLLAVGWLAGMCNEHTGPTAMVAMAGFVYAMWRRRQLRAWMVAGMLGLYVGYPMLVFAPGQAVRYGGLATRDTPSKLLADRGVVGCVAIVFDFLLESRLGVLLLLAAIARYVMVVRQRAVAPVWRTPRAAGVLVAAALAIVVTLFVSPIITDRVLFASGVLLVAAFAIVAEQLFVEQGVRRTVVAAVVALLGYHAVRFVATARRLAAENADRLALLGAAAPGTDVVVPHYADDVRSRWVLGDDFGTYPWLREYVGGELYDLARVDLDRGDGRATPRFLAIRAYAELTWDRRVIDRDIPPTYRQLQDVATRTRLTAALTATSSERLVGYTIRGTETVGEPQHRAIVVFDWTPTRTRFVDGTPDDEPQGHFIRVRRASLPAHVTDAYLLGCKVVDRVALVDDGVADPLIPVDERYCRGPFTAFLCERDACWEAGWY